MLSQKSVMSAILAAALASALLMAVSAWSAPMVDVRPPAVPPVASGWLEGADLSMTCAQLRDGVRSAELWKERALEGLLGKDPCDATNVAGCPIEWAMYRVADRVQDEFQAALDNYCPEA